MYPMILDEYQLVAKHREHLKYLKEKKIKQESCNHNWRCTGHSHNDDAYECTICGKIDFW